MFELEQQLNETRDERNEMAGESERLSTEVARLEANLATAKADAEDAQETSVQARRIEEAIQSAREREGVLLKELDEVKEELMKERTFRECMQREHGGDSAPDMEREHEQALNELQQSLMVSHAEALGREKTALAEQYEAEVKQTRAMAEQREGQLGASLALIKFRFFFSWFVFFFLLVDALLHSFLCSPFLLTLFVACS